MSLGVVVKGPEGVVLAADSRVTLTAQLPNEPPMVVNFDNATKLLSFGEPHDYVGAVTYGAAVIGLRTAHSYIPEFELGLPEERLGVEEFAERLSAFFGDRWNENQQQAPGPGIQFVVGGYDPSEPYGSVFVFDIPNQPQPEPKNPGNEFGIAWGGQLGIMARLIHGYDPKFLAAIQERFETTAEDVQAFAQGLKPQLEFRIPYQVLPLQDCIDLATFMVRTTMTAQNLGIGVRGVGGQIDVAYVSRTQPIKYVQRKIPHGEAGATGEA